MMEQNQRDVKNYFHFLLYGYSPQKVLIAPEADTSLNKNGQP